MEVREDWIEIEKDADGTIGSGCDIGTTTSRVLKSSPVLEPRSTVLEPVPSPPPVLEPSPMTVRDMYSRAVNVRHTFTTVQHFGSLYSYDRLFKTSPCILRSPKNNLCPISRLHIRFSHCQRSAAFCGCLYNTQYASRCRTASRCEYWDGYIFAIQATHGRRCIT